MDEVTILEAIASGTKGYVDAAASPADFVQAIRIVSQGLVWAPRRVLSMFIERVSSSPGSIFFCRPGNLYRPREESPGDAGARPIEQGNWRHTRYRSAHRESPRSEAAAQDWRTESR